MLSLGHACYRLTVNAAIKGSFFLCCTSAHVTVFMCPSVQSSSLLDERNPPPVDRKCHTATLKIQCEVQKQTDAAARFYWALIRGQLRVCTGTSRPTPSRSLGLSLPLNGSVEGLDRKSSIQRWRCRFRLCLVSIFQHVCLACHLFCLCFQFFVQIVISKPSCRTLIHKCPRRPRWDHRGPPSPQQPLPWKPVPQRNEAS